MTEGAELMALLDGQMPTWSLLARYGSSAPAAAKLMRCSRRTALKSLKSASEKLYRSDEMAKIALEVAEEETRLGAALHSNWPVGFSELAARIENEGQSSVERAERAAVVSKLPRGIGVGR